MAPGLSGCVISTIMLMFKFNLSYFDKFIKHMTQEQVQDNFESEQETVNLMKSNKSGR